MFWLAVLLLVLMKTHTAGEWYVPLQRVQRGKRSKLSTPAWKVNGGRGKDVQRKR